MMNNSPDLVNGSIPTRSVSKRSISERSVLTRAVSTRGVLIFAALTVACGSPERSFDEATGGTGASGGADSGVGADGGTGPGGTANGGARPGGDPGNEGGAAGGPATDTCDPESPPACFSSLGSSCAQGVVECSEDGSAGACDLLGLSSDVEHCGESCGACDAERADTCAQGLCMCGDEPGCAGDDLCCGEGGDVACVSPEDDPNHCGACGSVCPAGSDDEQAVCVGGQCGIVCVAPNYRCSGSTRLGCGQDGEWAVEEECTYGCFGDRCGDCQPGTAKCGGSGRELCSAQGQWQAAACSSSTQCTGAGTCLKKDGQPCKSSGECVSTCNVFYDDADGDGYFGTAVSLCGSSPPSGYSSTANDCCDTDARARPGQTAFYATARTGCGGHDFDCDKSEVKQYTRVVTQCGSSEACSRNVGGGAWRDDAPDCGSSASWSTGCYQSGSDWCPAHDESRTQGCR